MHTAFDFKGSSFAVSIEGAPATREDLLDWGPQDRLGVVIDRPAGALGAGLLILLAVTAFYDVPEKKRRRKPIYPEIHIFNAGGPWGPFGAFDFFPDYKEVFVEGGASEMLRAINARGITHLVLPDRPRGATKHRFKEPEAAMDRIKQCFAYSPGGMTAEADVVLTSEETKILDTYYGVLDIDDFLTGAAEMPANSIPLRFRAADDEENRQAYAAIARRAANELKKDHPDHMAARTRVDAARTAGRIEESYRRLSVDAALEMLP